MKYRHALIVLLLVLAAATSRADLVQSGTSPGGGKYIAYTFAASGTGNTITLPSASLISNQRVPYAVEWIDGTVPIKYPATVTLTSGAWTMTWTLTAADRYQFYFDAAGDSTSPPTISGPVTVTISAYGQPTASLGGGSGTLRLIFW